MHDLFGRPAEIETQVVAFHDERRQRKEWLYHGFLIVERGDGPELASMLEEHRRRAVCEKAVHFVGLDGSSRRSSRTKLAVAWARALDRELLERVRFFLLGVDTRKIDRWLFGSDDGSRSEVETCIYNRFFEIGLFMALRWFFTRHDKVELVKIFAEKRDLPVDDPFLSHAPYRIEQRDSNVVVRAPEVTMVPGKAEDGEWPVWIRDSLQMTDVFVGAFAQVLDNPNRKAGCCEVAEAVLSQIRKTIENPFNVNSRAYKRLAVRFFPDKSIDEQIYEAERPYGRMYEQRELKFLNPAQLTLFDWSDISLLAPK